MAQELVRCDCGHEVSRERVISKPEVRICENCYSPFSVDRWPAVLDSRKSYAGQHYSGHAEYHTTKTVLLGLDKRGRAVYWDQTDSVLAYVVPMHDDAYEDDRERVREESYAGLRPVENYHVGPSAEPPSDPSYHNLPNGDLLVKVEYEDGYFRDYEHREVGQWLRDNAHDWQAIHPDMVERFHLEGRFGTESGQPLAEKYCYECGYSGMVDSGDCFDCPECGHYKFRHTPPEKAQ